MTHTVDRVMMNNIPNNLVSSDIIVLANIHSGPIAVPGPLKWSVNITYIGIKSPNIEYSGSSASQSRALVGTAGVLFKQLKDATYTPTPIRRAFRIQLVECITAGACRCGMI